MIFGGRGDLTEWCKDQTFTLISDRKQIWNDIITSRECIVLVTDVLMGLVDVTCLYKSQKHARRSPPLVVCSFGILTPF